MNQVYQVVSRASRRLMAIHLLRTLALLATAAITLAIIARLVERVFGLGAFFAPVWGQVLIWTPIAVLVLSLGWVLIRRKKSLAVARELDERAGLRETLSTSMSIDAMQAERSQPWNQAVIENAQRTASSVRVGQAIPIEAPRFWPVPIGAALALLVVWIAVPVIDVLGLWSKEVALEQQRRQVVEVKADVQQRTDKVKEMLAKAKIEFVDDETSEAAAEQKPTENDPEAIRRAAVKKLTEMTDKLESMKEGEKADQIEALKEAMRQLRQPGPGPMDEFSRSLARGDFNKANEQLQQMQKQLANGDMSPEQREEAKKQMENLAKQLEKLGENKEALAKKLEESGLDKEKAKELMQKAGDPQALKEALEQSKGLSEEQKQELMQMCKSGMAAAQTAENMSEAMSKMAQGMQQQGMQQEGAQGMEQLSQELSNAEMLESDMENLDAALNEAKEQLSELAGQCMGDGQCNGEGDQPGKGGQGGWRQGNTNKSGNGSGGPGKGNGASPEAEAVDFTVEKTKAKTKTGGGPIIGTRLVYGQQVRGESKAAFSDAVAASAAEAAEAVESQQVPRELHNAVKHYFGTLEGKVKPQKPEPKPEPAEEGEAGE
jgi:chemotaxis protein histidine kinase CheA